MSHHFQNGITYAIQIDYREDLEQVDTKKDNLEDLIMMIQNIVKYMCSTKRLMPPLTGI